MRKVDWASAAAMAAALVAVGTAEGDGGGRPRATSPAAGAGQRIGAGVQRRSAGTSLGEHCRCGGRDPWRRSPPGAAGGAEAGQRIADGLGRDRQRDETGGRHVPAVAGDRAAPAGRRCRAAGLRCGGVAASRAAASALAVHRMVRRPARALEDGERGSPGAGADHRDGGVRIITLDPGKGHRRRRGRAASAPDAAIERARLVADDVFGARPRRHMAALSVHSSGGGADGRKPRAAHKAAMAWRSAWLAATPPATTMTRSLSGKSARKRSMAQAAPVRQEMSATRGLEACARCRRRRGPTAARCCRPPGGWRSSARRRRNGSHRGRLSGRGEVRSAGGSPRRRLAAPRPGRPDRAGRGASPSCRRPRPRRIVEGGAVAGGSRPTCRDAEGLGVAARDQQHADRAGATPRSGRGVSDMGLEVIDGDQRHAGRRAQSPWRSSSLTMRPPVEPGPGGCRQRRRDRDGDARPRRSDGGGQVIEHLTCGSARRSRAPRRHRPMFGDLTKHVDWTRMNPRPSRRRRPDDGCGGLVAGGFEAEHGRSAWRHVASTLLSA